MEVEFQIFYLIIEILQESYNLIATLSLDNDNSNGNNNIRVQILRFQILIHINIVL